MQVIYSHLALQGHLPGRNSPKSPIYCGSHFVPCDAKHVDTCTRTIKHGFGIQIVHFFTNRTLRFSSCTVLLRFWTWPYLTFSHHHTIPSIPIQPVLSASFRYSFCNISQLSSSCVYHKETIPFYCFSSPSIHLLQTRL